MKSFIQRVLSAFKLCGDHYSHCMHFDGIRQLPPRKGCAEPASAGHAWRWHCCRCEYEEFD